MKRNSEPQEGDFQGHFPCVNCSSSDGMAVYKKVDEKTGEEYEDGYCFSCQKHATPKMLGGDFRYEREQEEKEEYMSDETMEEMDRIMSLPTEAGWAERYITKTTSDFYGVHSEFDGNATEKRPRGRLKARYYPTTEDGNIVGFKVRELPKKFSVVGRCKGTSEMFGQRLFNKGGKFLVICGGEEDAMALYQTLYDNSGGKFRTACVAPTTGEGSTAKQLRANFDWVSSFENVILMLDNDAAGEEATQEALKVLKPSQARIAKLNLKDPCEYLKARRKSDLVQAFWKAEKYSPAGIVGSSQTWDALVQRAKWEKIPLPAFATQLQDMLSGGIALGEITTLAAASSIGKTTVVNEFLYHFIFNSPYKVGVISLESDLGELTENLMSLHINKKIANMDDDEKVEYYQTEEAQEVHRDLTTLPNGEDRFMILDHQGDVSDDDLQTKMEFLVKGCGCKVIILDPLTLALSGEGNEGMDLFMSWLLRFVKREMIAHINVVHVRKSGSGAKANSNGAVIHEEDIKGSGSIFQVSMNNILLMRDKESDNEIVRNTTKAVQSKGRRCGNTGAAGLWYYNPATARLEVAPEVSDEGYEEDEALFREFDAFNDINPDEKA